VARERRRYFEEGLEVALMPRKPARPRRRVLDGRAEARLIALACSDPPEGRERWTLRLLADRMVETEATTWYCNAHKKLVWCTERRGRVIDFWIVFSNVVILVRRLIRKAWSLYRWESRPSRRP
jgi:hypothetical protein